MLSENLRVLRKKKGLSQEELAIRLHVVRQTVSKWEKGISVPDADMLLRLAEILETTVSSLLGASVSDEAASDDIVEQLSRINEQLAVKNRRARRIWQIVLGVFLVSLAVSALLILLSLTSFRQLQTDRAEISNSVESELVETQ